MGASAIGNLSGSRRFDVRQRHDGLKQERGQRLYAHRKHLAWTHA